MADTKQLAAMLKKLGWGSGFRLPIANEENRKLEELLDAKQTRLVALSHEVQETSMAVDNLTSNLKHVNAKIKHSKEVEAAKRSQLEKEKQILSLSEREHAKTEQDRKKMAKSLKELQERNSIQENSVLRRKDELAELIDVINFDKKAIAAFEERFNKEDSYIKFINEVAETDNVRALNCREEYRKLGEMIETSRTRLDQTVSDSDILESEFQSLALRFRKAHGERNQTIENWKGTLVALEQRDEEIMHTCYDHNKIALRFRTTKDLYDKQEAFLARIQQQTKAHEIELSLLERKMNNLNRKKRELDVEVEDNTDAVSDLGAYVLQIDKEIKRLVKQMDKLSNETDTWFDKMVKIKDELDCLKMKYDMVTKEQCTSTTQYSQLQEFLDKEEKHEEALVREVEKQTNWKSQKDAKVFDLKEDLALLEAKDRNMKSAIVNLKKESRKMGDRLIRTRAMEYRLDLKVLNLCTKLRAFENPDVLYTTRDDFIEFQTKMNRMREKVVDLEKTQELIRTQTNHCQQVTAICMKELDKEKAQNKQYEIHLHRLAMESKRISKEEEAALEIIKDRTVTYSLLQVQMRRMVTSIQDYESKLLDLEQDRLTLQTVVKSRKKDIETYCTLLLSKKRALQDEAQKLRSKCHDVRCEAQSRKRKYEMVMIQMWQGGGNDAPSQEERQGSSRSEAYFIIKMAQETEHYRMEGDKWDQRVKEAEKVVEGLQNTLALMIGTNEAFKESLKPVTANTEEGEQVQLLKNQQYEAARNLKLAKLRRAEVQQQLSKMHGILDQSNSAKGDKEHIFLEKQYELQGLIVEINGQKEKIKRATNQANKLVKELSKLDSLDAELLQNDLRLRITREKFEFAVATLERFLTVHPKLLEETLQFLQEKKMISLCNRLSQNLYSLSASQISSPYSTSPHGSESEISVRRQSSRRSTTRLSKT